MMDSNNSNVENGHISLAVTIFGGIVAWFTSHNVAEIVKVVSAVISVGAGAMAIRYYYYATKKIK